MHGAVAVEMSSYMHPSRAPILRKGEIFSFFGVYCGLSKRR
jgi:hypothetical protein